MLGHVTQVTISNRQSLRAHEPTNFSLTHKDFARTYIQGRKGSADETRTRAHLLFGRREKELLHLLYLLGRSSHVMLLMK